MHPLSMAEGAIAVHEIYTSFVSAGFTEEQAFEILKIIVLTQYSAPNGN